MRAHSLYRPTKQKNEKSIIYLSLSLPHSPVIRDRIKMSQRVIYASYSPLIGIRDTRGHALTRADSRFLSRAPGLYTFVRLYRECIRVEQSWHFACENPCWALIAPLNSQIVSMSIKSYIPVPSEIGACCARMLLYISAITRCVLCLLFRVSKSGARRRNCAEFALALIILIYFFSFFHSSVLL